MYQQNGLSKVIITQVHVIQAYMMIHDVYMMYIDTAL